MKMMGLIILLVGIAATSGDAQLSLHGCPDKCGVDIPYPFGVGDRCSLNQYFNLTCYHSNSTLYFSNSNIQVLNISLDGHMDISTHVSQNCYDDSGVEVDGHSFSASLTTTAFPISSSENKFVSVGCDSYAYLTSFQQDGQSYYTGCLSKCSQPPPLVNNTANETCSGIGCCQVDIPPQMRNITYESYSFKNHLKVRDFNNCSYAFVAKTGSFHFSPDYLESLPFNKSQLVLDWSIVDEATFQQPPALSIPKPICNPNAFSQNSPGELGYRCSCKQGFQGNPYIPDGCQDVNECDAPNSHNCDIKAHALCNNFDGGYNCSCLPGYSGDGRVDGTRCTRDSSPDRSHSLIIALGVCVALLVGFTLLSTLCWAHKQQTLKQIRERIFEQNGGNELL